MKMVTGRLRALGASAVRAARSLRSTRQRIEVGVALLAAVACIVAAGIQVGPALAETKIEGKQVPPDMLPAIVVGATSCPALTGPRLAGQLMAASKLQATARSDSGEGIADLSAADWKQWAPWKGAQRSDVLASVQALAHRTCNYVGKARDAGVDGDDWEAAVAGGLVGIDEVIRAKAVPDAVRKQVDTVAGYANWYADQPEFNDGKSPEPQDSPSPEPSVVKVPEEFVEPIREAGRICPGVLPASRVAAQLMALSGFNASLRGPNGGQGIAQFTDSMWREYRPSRRASVWDPAVAIPAMGTAMCDLRNQLSGLRADRGSGDSFTLAMAAYQWGVTAVRAEGGVPRHASVKQLPDLVTRFQDNYRSDTRLADEATENKPSPSPSVSPSVSPSASPSVSPSVSPSPSPAVEPPVVANPVETPADDPTTQAPKTWDAGARWQIKNKLSGRVMELPGNDNATAVNTTVQLYDNKQGEDQHWMIINAPDREYVTIANLSSYKVLAIRDSSRDNGAELVMVTSDSKDFNQQWKLQETGNGEYAIINRNSGKALDITGNDCCANNATPITQWDLQNDEIDMHWTLTRTN